MLKKGLLISLAVMLLVSVVGFVGCGKPEIVSESTIPGKYVNVENPGKSLLIRNNGTAISEWEQFELTFTYEWELDGDILVIRDINLSVIWQRFEVRGNKLIDESGTDWVKQ